MPSQAERVAPSLQTRLLVAYLAAWLGTATLLAGGLLIYLRGDPMHWADHSSAELASALIGTVSQGEGGHIALGSPPEAIQWLAQAAPQELGWRVLDARGQVLAWNAAATQIAWETSGVSPVFKSGPGQSMVAGRPLRTWTQAAALPGGTVWLQVGLSERLIRLIHSGSALRLGGTVAATVALSILLLGVAQFFVLRKLLRPLRRLSREAEAISRKPGRRLDRTGLPAELQPLVQAFNQALDSVQLGFERQLRFLADAAHELKTPIALIRAQVELGEGPEVLLDDIDHMARQVQQLLLLAEVSELHGYRRQPLDVAAVVDDVSRFLQPLALRQRVLLWTDTATSPRGLVGDRDALFALVKNLAENAISCAPIGSAVQITLAPDALVVRDYGTGIAPEHFEHLFKRFWRAPNRRDRGAGLGLAICEAVSQAHGWRIVVRNAQPGAEFTLLFSPSK